MICPLPPAANTLCHISADKLVLICRSNWMFTYTFQFHNDDKWWGVFTIFVSCTLLLLVHSGLPGELYLWHPLFHLPIIAPSIQWRGKGGKKEKKQKYCPVSCVRSSFSSRGNESCCVTVQSISNVLVYSTHQTDSRVNTRQRSLMVFFGATVYIDAWWGEREKRNNRTPNERREQWLCQNCSEEIGRERWRSWDFWQEN